MSSVGSYLSGVTYDGIGRVAGTTMGNGVTEGFGYDTTRMQLTSQTATKNGGPTNGLMSLTYGYDAPSGQMGTGSTAGNAGQLMSISGTINSTTESAAYSYDDLGRLVTANQTSNGSSAQRRFAYDRWGNRTGVWNAVSGGTQIQSITLQQSGGVPTNQIQSVTSGSTVSYTYDSAGNVTNDGAHIYTYDAENRIANVDGGSTATYAYDQSNQRFKKTVGSAVTHYIWQGSRVIAEHNGSTGASTADYVYSGSRMIAKASGLTTQYFLSDRLSERVVLSASGSVLGRMAHLPFGEDFSESGTQEKHHFTSYETDAESGTDYAVNREYSPLTGRFQSTDPYRSSSNASNAQSWNRYSYVLNNPVDFNDPLGLLLGIPWTNPWYCYVFPWLCSDAFPNVPIGNDPGARRDQPDPPPDPGVRVPLSGDRLLKYQSERDRLVGLLNDATSDCAKFLLKQLGLSGSRVAKAVLGQRPFDGLLSTITVLRSGINNSTGLLADWRVNDLFMQIGEDSDLSATAFYANPLYGATIRDVYYAPNAIQAPVILHETLHYFLGATDEDLASRLGIDLKYMQEQGTRVISWKLRDAGCR